MNIIPLSVSRCGCGEPICIGVQGENGVTQVQLDFSPWSNEFGSGELSVEILRFGDVIAYAVEPDVSGTVAIWTVSDVDTGVAGIGAAGFVYRVDGKVKKSVTFRTLVTRDVGGPVGDVPDPYDSLIRHIEELAAQTEENADKAEAARQAIEDLGVEAHDLPARSEPTVEKIVDPETGAGRDV